VFVLLIGMVYEVHFKMGSGGMKYTPSSINIGAGMQAILRFCLKES
jgi:hypothetical protein